MKRVEPIGMGEVLLAILVGFILGALTIMGIGEEMDRRVRVSPPQGIPTIWGVRIDSNVVMGRSYVHEGQDSEAETFKPPEDEGQGSGEWTPGPGAGSPGEVRP